MKTTCFLFISIIMIWLALAGCDVNKKNPVQQESAFTMSEFPMDVYTRWTYSVHDTITGTYDTVDVLIFDTTHFPEEHYATVWLFSGLVNSYGRDCVSIFGDTLKFFHNRSSVADRYLVFPIEIGNGWGFSHNAGYDSDVVVTEEPVSVPYGEMTAYRIHCETTPLALDLIRFSNIWLAPGVGLVKAEYASGFRIVDHYEIWELIEFRPPK